MQKHKKDGTVADICPLQQGYEIFAKLYNIVVSNIIAMGYAQAWSQPNPEGRSSQNATQRPISLSLSLFHLKIPAVPEAIM